MNAAFIKKRFTALLTWKEKSSNCNPCHITALKMTISKSWNVGLGLIIMNAFRLNFNEVVVAGFMKNLRCPPQSDTIHDRDKMK
jgi:hypothetical protein